MYLNEEGKITDPPLPANDRATALAHDALLPGDYIAGTAVILGPVDDDGNDTACELSLADIVGS
jgi:hypothetical protein